MGGPPAAGFSGGLGAAVVTVRKYANRRLYDVSRSRHITQDELYEMAAKGVDVLVTDAVTGEDITNVTLAACLIERDPAKMRLVPTWAMLAMIRMTERALSNVAGRAWWGAMESMMRGGSGSGVPVGAMGGGVGPMMQGMMPGWGAAWPFGGGGVSSPQAAAGDAEVEGDSVEAIRRQIEELSRRLAEIERSGGR